MDTQNKTGNPLPTSPIEFTPDMGRRIKSVIESVGGLAKAGELAGVTDETVGKWRDGKVKPPLLGVATIAIAAGRSVDWLVFGASEGDSEAPSVYPALPADKVPAQVGFYGEAPPTDFTMVPRLDVQASAGHGLAALAEDVVERLAFRTEWLRDMGLSPQFLALVTCRGDSQDPIIKDGALMLVDTRSDQHIRSGCFYIIVLDGDVLVKLVNRRIDGTIELISHNSAYPKEIIDSQQLDRLTIPGQVVWYGQKL